MIFSERFNVWNEGSITQLWNIAGRIKFSKYVDHTLIYTNNKQCCACILQQKVFIFGVGIYISALEYCRKMKFRMQFHLT